MKSKKEGRTVSPNAPEGKPSSPIVIDAKAYRKAFSKRDHGWRPYVEMPQSKRDAIGKINHGIVAWTQSTEEQVYTWGCWLKWLKEDGVPYGEFESAVKELCFKSTRSARNAMAYVDACEENGQRVPYDPNHRRTATVAVLEPPESHKGKLEKPKAKDTETDWTEDGAASMLLEYFIKLTRHCTIEEKESVSHKTIEALQEHVAAEREEYDEE
jgi:hypothetical protein